MCLQGYIREEALIAQLDELFRNYAMPSTWQAEFEKLIAEGEHSSSLKNVAFVQELREKVYTISHKLDRLTDLYIASPPYVALRAARANFSETDPSFIRAARLGFEPRYYDSES